MRLSYHARARQELANTANWYEHELPGLGRRFLDAYKAALSRILEHPEANPVVWGECRLALIKTFPYGIVYRLDGEVIHIDCIRHHARHPRFGFGRK